MLRQKQHYCILNTQYSKEDYEKLVPRILEHMKSTGEWGEFFPVSLSPFSYNETSAYEYYPMTQEDVLKKGWKWRDKKAEQSEVSDEFDIPDRIDDVTDDICNRVLRCGNTGKQYMIIPQELRFYREVGVPLPRVCPAQRHSERMSLSPPRCLWDGQCHRCGAGMYTTFHPGYAGIVYCEKCYMEAVY